MHVPARVGWLQWRAALGGVALLLAPHRRSIRCPPYGSPPACCPLHPSPQGTPRRMASRASLLVCCLFNRHEQRGQAHARRLFLASLAYLPVFFVCLILHQRRPPAELEFAGTVEAEALEQVCIPHPHVPNTSKHLQTPPNIKTSLYYRCAWRRDCAGESSACTSRWCVPGDPPRRDIIHRRCTWQPRWRRRLRPCRVAVPGWWRTRSSREALRGRGSSREVLRPRRRNQRNMTLARNMTLTDELRYLATSINLASRGGSVHVHVVRPLVWTKAGAKPNRGGHVPPALGGLCLSRGTRTACFPNNKDYSFSIT